MANTSPDGLWSPDASDPLVLRTLTAEMQASNQVAFGNRQLYTYRWPNAVARLAQAGMENGDEGFQSDTQTTYKRLDSSWKIWSLPLSGYTPSWSGINISSGTVEGYWSMSAGVVTCEVVVTAGSNTSATGSMSFSAPITPLNGQLVNVGTGRFVDASSGQNFMAAVLLVGGSLVPRPIVTTSTYADIVPTTSTVPFSWATGDRVEFYCTYYAY